MEPYDRLRERAKALLEKYGGTATLERRTRTYNTATGGTTETPANLPVKAALLAPESKTTPAERRGETVDRTRYAIIGSQHEPKPGDTLLMAGIRYPVSGITAIAPDGTAIIYRLALGDA